MRKTIIVIFVVVIALTVGIAFAGETTGNGAPKVKKVYSLNIIGVPGEKNPDMNDNSGHRIFVPLEGKAKIELIEGDDFTVLDANGTDGPAQFQLPAPGLDAYVVGNTNGKDTVSDYSVFIRPLGPPGGWATITTCAQLIDSTFGTLLPNSATKTILNNFCTWDGAYASVEQVGSEITLRKSGQSRFQNVTAELLTIVFKVEVDADGDSTTTDDIYRVYVRAPIFDDSLYGEYWEYDNQGLKILQVRFYEIGTDVSENDGSLPPLD